jgi:hypothetical protein
MDEDNYYGRSDESLVAHQRAMGVTTMKMQKVCIVYD